MVVVFEWFLRDCSHENFKSNSNEMLYKSKWKFYDQLMATSCKWDTKVIEDENRLSIGNLQTVTKYQRLYLYLAQYL